MDASKLGKNERSGLDHSIVNKLSEKFRIAEDSE